MHLVCVGRHALLADHFAAVFAEAGARTRPVVGLHEAAEAAMRERPAAVLCDYDLLATNPLGPWEANPDLAGIPIIAISLTRRPDEACAFDVNGIAGFLYLPTLDPAAALRTLEAMMHRAQRVPAPTYHWDGVPHGAPDGAPDGTPDVASAGQH